jgi:hypothetical protein
MPSTTFVMVSTNHVRHPRASPAGHHVDLDRRLDVIGLG